MISDDFPIGREVRRLRELRNWTQEELAEASGLAVRTVRRIEREETGGDGDTRLKLAAAFGIAVEDLLLGGQRGVSGDALARYRQVLEQSTGPRTARFVPLLTADGESVFEKVLTIVAAKGHACIAGPPGSGKSYIQLRVAHQLSQGGKVPVVARVKFFTGAFASWIDEAARAYGAEGLAQLHSDATKQGYQLVLLIDGVNECHGDLRDGLLEALQGEATRRDICLVLSTQGIPEAWAKAVALQVVTVAPLDDATRTALANQYALSSNEQLGIPSAFRSPIEVAYASEVWTQLPLGATRFQLIYAYVRRSLERSLDGASVFRGLRELAFQLTQLLLVAIPEHELLRNFERGGNRLSGEDALRTTLFWREHGVCGFSHELIQQYFAAEALMLANSHMDALARSLDAPTTAGLSDLVLEAQTLPEHISRLLTESKSCRRCFAPSLLGKHGETVRSVAHAIAASRIRDAIDNLQAGKLVIDPQTNKLRVKCPREWTHDELSLFVTLGGLCRTESVRLLVRQLLQASDEFLARSVSQAAFAKLRNTCFEALYELYSETPFSAVLNGAKNNLNWPYDLVEGTDEEQVALGPAEEYLGCVVLRAVVRHATRDERYINGVLEQRVTTQLMNACNSSYLRVRMIGVEVAGDVAHSLSSEARAIVLGIVQGARIPNKVLLNDVLLETLDTFGALEPVYDAADVASELRALLQRSSDSEAQYEAYGIFGRQMEFLSAITAPHIEAVSELTQAESATFHAMVALGARQSPYASAVSLALRTLSKNGCARSEPLARPAVLAWLGAPLEGTPMPTDAVDAFLAAHEALVTLSLTPPEEEPPREAVPRAWWLLGILVREAVGPDVSGANPASVWSELCGERLLVALVPVLRVASSNLYAFKESGVRFANQWRAELAEFCRSAVRRWSELPDDWNTWPRPKEHVLQLFGQLGEERDIQQLRELVSGSEMPEAALAAIQSIRARS